MNPQRLGCHIGKFFFVKHSCSGIVFFLSVHSRTIVLVEKSHLKIQAIYFCTCFEILKEMVAYSIGISSELHAPQLQPGPLRVELRGPNKGKVNTQVAMNWWAINTNEDTKRDCRPCGVFGSAIETYLEEIFKKLRITCLLRSTCAGIFSRGVD